MPRAVSGDAIYRRRRFPSDVIELCVRWYITYRLSYRDLSAMMAEHGVTLTHTTIMRWVLRYVPEYERRWARFARPVGSSWRTAETAVAVRGKHHYLYRAVDKSGKSVDSLVSPEFSDTSEETDNAIRGVSWEVAGSIARSSNGKQFSSVGNLA